MSSKNTVPEMLEKAYVFLFREHEFKQITGQD